MQTKGKVTGICLHTFLVHKINYTMTILYFQLKNANLVVLEEIHKLDHSADEAFATIDDIFDEISKNVERHRNEVLAHVKKTKDEKRKLLEDQLKRIKDEEMELGDDEIQDVENINEKILNLNNKMETFSNLSEPVDNYYLKFKPNILNDINGNMTELLSNTGTLETTNAMASTSTLSTESQPILHLESEAIISIADSKGEILANNNFLDILKVRVKDQGGADVVHEVKDNCNGTFSILFTPSKIGNLTINATLFDRALQNSPLTCMVTAHNPPVASFGSKGIGDEGFVQPCSVISGWNLNIFLAFKWLRFTSGRCLKNNNDILEDILWKIIMVYKNHIKCHQH